jgi:hypothetical protein
LVGFALLLVAVAVSAALLFYVAGKRPVPREKFIAAVVGLTPGEVRGRVGDPDGTTYGGLRYDRVTYDPATGRVDQSAWLWVDGGRVSFVTVVP